MQPKIRLPVNMWSACDKTSLASHLIYSCFLLQSMVLTITLSQLLSPEKLLGAGKPSHPTEKKTGPSSLNYSEKCLLMTGALPHESVLLLSSPGFLSCFWCWFWYHPRAQKNLRTGWTSTTEWFGRNILEERRLVFSSSKE